MNKSTLSKPKAYFGVYWLFIAINYYIQFLFRN